MAVLLTGRNKIKTTVTRTKRETATFYPAAYDTSSYSYASISNATNPVGKGSDNTTYATIALKTGGSAETYVFFPFDLSGLPANAVIETVECTAKGYISNTSTLYISSNSMQLYAGSTAKGSAVTLTTTATAHAMTCGEWTRAELTNCRIRLYAKRGSFLGTSSSQNMQFYGADLTVTYNYTYEEEVWV